MIIILNVKFADMFIMFNIGLYIAWFNMGLNFDCKFYISDDNHYKDLQKRLEYFKTFWKKKVVLKDKKGNISQNLNAL